MSVHRCKDALLIVSFHLLLNGCSDGKLKTKYTLPASTSSTASTEEITAGDSIQQFQLGIENAQILDSQWNAPGSFGNLEKLNIILRQLAMESYDIPTDYASLYYQPDLLSTAENKAQTKLYNNLSTKNAQGETVYPFAVDEKNYFDEWNCNTSLRYKNIRKLGILPLATHHRNMWKDNLSLSSNEYSGGFPVIYFTQGLREAGLRPISEVGKIVPTLHSLKKAYFNSSAQMWIVADVAQVDTPGGLSSLEGGRGDFVLNVFETENLTSAIAPGRAPSTVLPPGQTNIPGVSRNPISSKIPYYPLYGDSPDDGLDAVINHPDLVLAPTGSEVGSCTHMNPAFFDFDGDGVPQKFTAYLSWGGLTTKGCKVGAQELSAGNYVYRYDPAIGPYGRPMGWRLDSLSPIEGIQTGEAINSVSYSQSKLFRGDKGGYVYKFEPNPSMPGWTQSAILDCSQSGMAFSEPSGSANVFIMLGAPTAGGAEGTDPSLYNGPSGRALVNDIYLVSVNSIIGANPKPTGVSEEVIQVYRDTLGINPSFEDGFDWTLRVGAGELTIDELRDRAASAPETINKIEKIFSLVCNRKTVFTEMSAIYSNLSKPTADPTRKTLIQLAQHISSNNCILGW